MISQEERTFFFRPRLHLNIFSPLNIYILGFLPIALLRSLAWPTAPTELHEVVFPLTPRDREGVAYSQVTYGLCDLSEKISHTYLNFPLGI